MTDTELIATKLLGWEKGGYAPYRGTRYVHDEYSNVLVFDDGSYSGSENWFNPVDYNDIRHMEDALAERGLDAEYANQLVLLWEEMEDAGKKLPVSKIKAGRFHERACLRATAAQRVAACVAVIKEAVQP